METVKGKLIKAKKGKGWRVAFEDVANDHVISEAAQCFSVGDAEDGMKVDVELKKSKKGKFIYTQPCRVTIPGKAVVEPKVQTASSRGGNSRGASQGPSTTSNGNSSPKADPKVLGQPFHNPYTFIPFHLNHPRHTQSTPLTIDELQEEREERYSGVLTLTVKTESPLLTCSPIEARTDERTGHKSYNALRIGKDVIVPATGVRGALRSLMMILTGGSLTYMNEYAYLCQDRDANLGPRTKYNPDLPKNVFLAEVVRPGTMLQKGSIRLGETKRVKMLDLHHAFTDRTIKQHRKPGSKVLYIAFDNDGIPQAQPQEPALETSWKVKLSGKPVGSRDRIKGKYEGAFKPGEKVIQLPSELWAAYLSRNVHGDRPELQKGDLIWLELKNKGAESIASANEIESIQWARWGKRGEALQDCLPGEVLPDYLRTDISEVTDLFGMVDPSQGKSDNFSGRIRPENLVFKDGEVDEKVALAPLLAPHLGCIAFYRDNNDPDQIGKGDKLRGYKVYRTTKQRENESPWLYETQSLFDDSGAINRQKNQSVNKTCDLLQEGQEGRLRIAFRALSKRELALLIQACHVPWRLGGGKPLGLGLCSISGVELINENGDPLSWDWKLDWKKEVADIEERVKAWKQSQEPVSNLRYPRAEKNGKRGGHVWFARHATVLKNKTKGLQSFDLLSEAIIVSAQILPKFNTDVPEDDVLYGYDFNGTELEREENPQ